MNKLHSSSTSAFSAPRALLGLLLCSTALIVALSASGFFSVTAQPPTPQQNSVAIGRSYHNDISPPLLVIPPWSQADRTSEREANENPKVPNRHIDGLDPVIQSNHASSALAMAAAVAS